MDELGLIKKINETAYEFLVSFNPELIPDGRIVLSDSVYVNIESYETQLRCERFFEAHRKYIDIQYMIEGEELVTIASISDLRLSRKYDNIKDIELYYGDVIGLDYCLRNGDYLVIKPGEGHMPCIALNEKRKVRKAVIKIKVN